MREPNMLLELDVQDELNRDQEIALACCLRIFAIHSRASRAARTIWRRSKQSFSQRTSARWQNPPEHRMPR
jgi:hypothetical protein